MKKLIIALAFTIAVSTSFALPRPRTDMKTNPNGMTLSGFINYISDAVASCFD